MPSACKGTTTQGERCKRPATSTGFCTAHDPGRLAIRRADAVADAKRSERLTSVIDKVRAAARAKGWSAHVRNRDDAGHRYASIEVSRYVDGAEHVRGELEVDVSDAGVKVARQRTSFYGHGLETLHSAVMDAVQSLPWVAPRVKLEQKQMASPGSELSPVLPGVLRRFDRYARQLSRRYADRDGIGVKDEYDVQDLLHALLRSLTDDVRPEEVSPSYAGASSRLDFLLKKERIVIEVKLASSSLRDKQIGEQLIVDIKRYQTHPDCKMLLCLVYDPSNHIRNPQGIENDLSGKHGELEVKVFVVPR